MPSRVRQDERFLSKTQIWKDSCNRSYDVCSRSDAILDKASRSEEVQMTERQTSWSGRSSLVYGNCMHQFNRPDDIPHGSDAQALYMEIACS
jgi:hypothetical protein